MGTRNLTMVINKEGETKIAQYGQWGGYPSGNGLKVLDFVRNTDLKKFNEKINKLRFANAEDEKKLEDFMREIGSENGWMDMTQSTKYKTKFPQLSRDNGADILKIVMEKDFDFLKDSTNFAGDSLFCEWAYVIDLQKETLEVYKGFNQSELKEGDRFFTTEKDGDYEPVALIKSFSLNDLPTDEEFLKLEEIDEEE